MAKLAGESNQMCHELRGAGGIFDQRAVLANVSDRLGLFIV